MYNSQNNNQNSRTLVTTLILLLILSLGSSIYFWNKSRNAGASITSLTESVQALEAEKARIEHALDSLSAAYGEVRIENEGLRGKEASTAELIAQKDASIKKIKSQNNRELAALRAQLDELRQLKIEYETLITAVQVENEQLKAENQRLLGENQQLQTENSSLSGQVGDLAQKLEDQIRKTQSARFKATSFKVEIGRKNDKQTIRAKRAREINVGFDLIDVPEKYQGEQHLYLVITDEKGKAISSTKPIKTTIDAPTGSLQIEAQQVKAVSLAEKQRLSFNYRLDERLKSGNYVAAIYCNVGLLGASTFRLN
jgi:regulator of replication initiation timing